MKRAEIVVGGIYGNGKRSVRLVLGFQAQGLYHGVSDCDNLRYKVLESRCKSEVGETHTMTARSFASWAVSRENPVKPSPSMTPGCADTGD